jgi:hypothetical protein
MASGAFGVGIPLGFVHATVDQEVSGSSPDRSTDRRTGAMALSVVDRQDALAG